LRQFVEILSAAGLAPKTIVNVVTVAKLVVASAVDEEGDQLDYSACPTCPDSHELEADSRSGRAWRCAGVAILRATANIFMRPCL